MTTAAHTMATRVVDVEVTPHLGALRANLELPGPGDGVGGLWIPLSGWALAPAGEQVQIEVSHAGQVLARLPCAIERRDVAASFPEICGAERSGFSTAVGAARLPHAFDLCVSAVLRDHTIPFARVSGVRRSLEPGTELPVAPLVLTTLGRSGSTLLCALLGSHPAIAAFRPAGYDSRPFAYWLEPALALSSPASRLALLDSAVSADLWWLGREHAPADALQCLDDSVRELLLGTQLDELMGSALRHAASFASRLAFAEGKDAVRYAAEKCNPGHLPRLLHELCPQTREVILVRDFRDVLASMLAFNAKRGYPAFGREAVSSDEQFVRRLAADAAALAHAWRERRDCAVLVRYEELIETPDEVLRKVFESLELATSEDDLVGIVAAAQAALETTAGRHRTSDGVAVSTGRWRGDLPQALQELSADLFGEPLREFGYS